MPKYHYTIMYGRVEDGDGGTDMKVRRDYVEAPDITTATAEFQSILSVYADVAEAYIEDDPFELCLGCKSPLYKDIEYNFCPNCGHSTHFLR